MRALRTADLDFSLPEELIARHPPAERTAARLLVARGGGHEPGDAGIEHRAFADLPHLLAPGDLLVLNDTRVLPARLLLRKATGGLVEGLWLADLGGGRARVMLSGGRLRAGLELFAPAGGLLRLAAKLAPGEWEVASASAAAPASWEAWLERHGATPLPPYVRRARLAAGEPEEERQDRSRYQTIWADAAGSVAAPTASLHFAAPLLAALESRGVQLTRLTLHVGRGTFLPVTAPTLAAHAMHAEAFVVPEAAKEAIAACRARGGRVVAAGTTACRALEADARGEHGVTRLMITPGHPWRVVDALLTNFHTPRSTLLALVAAFAERLGAPDGLARVKEVYAAAVAARYRFFSFGDSSLWLPSST